MLAVRSSSWRLGSTLRNIQIRTTATASQGNVRPYSEIPGPKPIPLLGNAWRFLPVIGTIPMTDAKKWPRDLNNQYGDIVKISNLPGRKDMILVFNPESIEKVFRNEGQWPYRFPLTSMVYHRLEVRKDFFEGFAGLTNEYGESWQKARSVVNQPMMQPKVAKQYAAKIDQVALDFLKRIQLIRDKNQEMPEDFSNELQKWALESIALIALDARLGCLEASIQPDSDPQKMIDAVEAIFDCSVKLDLKIPFWKLFSTPTLKKFIKHSDILVEISHKYVLQAREKMSESTPEEDRSVLQKILQNDPSTKRAVIQAIDIMAAGIDTTSYTVATVLYYLSRNPECQEKLFSEVSKVIPDGPIVPLTSDNLDSMKYLKACIKEAMRFSPVVPGNVRSLNKDIELENYFIPGNTVDIMMLNSTLCHMEKHYPEANRYIPERWLRGDSSCPVTTNHKTHPFVYLPFGYGPRQCVGMRFANLEMETLLARIIRNYRIEWHYEDMKFETTLIQKPVSPLRFKIIDRSS